MPDITDTDEIIRIWINAIVLDHDRTHTTFDVGYRRTQSIFSKIIKDKDQSTLKKVARNYGELSTKYSELYNNADKSDRQDMEKIAELAKEMDAETLKITQTLVSLIEIPPGSSAKEVFRKALDEVIAENENFLREYIRPEMLSMANKAYNEKSLFIISTGTVTELVEVVHERLVKEGLLFTDVHILVFGTVVDWTNNNIIVWCNNSANKYEPLKDLKLKRHINFIAGFFDDPFYGDLGIGKAVEESGGKNFVVHTPENKDLNLKQADFSCEYTYLSNEPINSVEKPIVNLRKGRIGSSSAKRVEAESEATSSEATSSEATSSEATSSEATSQEISLLQAPSP